MGSHERDLRARLLVWYDVNARQLPWRVAPADRAMGIMPDPYKVWLSEIMLQQTTISTVKPYFERFLAAFPTVEAMASAPLDEILSRWAGLGYYARARNLHACAIAIVKAGGFPSSVEGLSGFVGIGPYTAAAIASIAFDTPSVPVDGNVERVLSRLLDIGDPLPASKPIFRATAARFEDAHRPGDFAQALMDLGSTVCTPRNPKCDLCPWQADCALNGHPDIEAYPKKTPKKPKPVRYGVAFVHLSEAGVLVGRRPDMGLLGGMLEVPGTPWRDLPWSLDEAQTFAPIADVTWARGDDVRHIFTHFDLRIEVYVADARKGAPFETPHSNALSRVALDGLDQAALPSVMMKIIQAGIGKQKLSS